MIKKKTNSIFLYLINIGSTYYIAFEEVYIFVLVPFIFLIFFQINETQYRSYHLSRFQH